MNNNGKSNHERAKNLIQYMYNIIGMGTLRPIPDLFAMIGVILDITAHEI